jgi:hypothetical protein
MTELKTANSTKHNYNKNFKRYLKTKSTRSVKAILRTQRLDAAFFWLDFYPLVRDMWLRKNKEFTATEFDILLQLHANQPFTILDINTCTITKRDIHNDDWHLKTKFSTKSARRFIVKCKELKIFKIRANKGRYNRNIYEFTVSANNTFRRLYEYMLCTIKIPTTDKDVVDPIIKKSNTHYKKMIKQNALADAFNCELERDIKTTNLEFSIKLKRNRVDNDFFRT